MININELTNEEINEIVGEFEDAINAYLEAKKDEILFLGVAMDFNIPNATDNEILDAILDIVSFNLSKELMKSFDASLVEEQEIVDIMVLEYLEEIFNINDLRRKRKWRHGKILRAMKENIKSAIWGK